MSDETLYKVISKLIDNRKYSMVSQINSSVVRLFWEIGGIINEDILNNKRAKYGKQIVSQIATQLQEKYGRSYESRNLRRMMQFAEQFPDWEIVSRAATQLSWSHFVEILPIKSTEAKMYYINQASNNSWEEIISESK